MKEAVDASVWAGPAWFIDLSPIAVQSRQRLPRSPPILILKIMLGFGGVVDKLRIVVLFYFSLPSTVLFVQLYFRFLCTALHG